MSTESSAVSRPPQSDSAPEGREAETPKSESRSKSLEELPTPQEKVREFLEEFGERAHVPLSESHGRALRPECVEQEFDKYSVWTDDGEKVTREEEVSATAVPLWQAVGNMLEWHEDYHKSTLRLEYGVESDPTHALLDIDLENSWFAAYQDKERAKLKALERETCGYETCEECGTRYCTETDEHSTEWVSGAFEQPVVVLTGRTASGAGRPPVDHARGIAEAWTDGEVRRSLRYILDEKLGLESEEWARWTQGEPHPGDGENSGYHHAHDVIILDGAAASEEVTPETFRTMIATHVSECDYAGPRAHDLDKSAEEWEKGNVETVSVKEVEGEIEESVASYAAAYLANEKVDLLEREPEYLAWAATMWATNTQKGIKSDSANHAIEADKCQHKHHDGERDFAHGEEKTRKPCRCAEAPYGPGCRRCDGRGFHIVCLGCLSPWQVEQEETLVEARRPDAPVAADGGAVPERETAEQEQEQELRDRWEDTRWAARVGGETAEREVSGRAEGRELEGRELELGGGAAYCAACGEEEPTGECSATAYKEESYGEYEVTRLGRSPGMLSSSYVYAKEGSSCPLPPEHFGEHTVVEGHDDAEKTVTTGSEEYRGDGHIPFEYESEPDGEAVEAGFERPPSWSAKAIIRDGEEVPATGGTTEKIELNLPSAPERLVALVAGEYGVAACQACGQHCDSPKAVVEHECESRLYAGWLGGGGPPTPETGVDYAEFVEAIPERLLTESSSSEDVPVEESEPELGERVRRYCANNPGASVPAVLGKFMLPEERAEEVAELVE